MAWARKREDCPPASGKSPYGVPPGPDKAGGIRRSAGHVIDKVSVEARPTSDDSTRATPDSRGCTSRGPSGLSPIARIERNNIEYGLARGRMSQVGPELRLVGGYGADETNQQY